MPCNAHGHPPDCNCGWGGVFHATRSSFEYGPGYWSQANSHTNPNAKCPVCGQRVFFYRSPDNGRVFFDALGPPWPKHPCTDAGATSKHGHSFTGYSTRNGWWPFLCNKIAQGAEGHGCVLYNTEGKALYVNTRPASFSLDTPVWIKRLVDKRAHYLVSTLMTKSGKTVEVQFDGFKTFSALMETRLHRGAQPAKPRGIVQLPGEPAATPKVAAPPTRARIQVLHKPILNLQKNKNAEETQELRTDSVTVAGTDKTPPTSPRRQFVRKPAPSVSDSELTAKQSSSAMGLAFQRLASTEKGEHLLGGLLCKG